MMGERSDTMRKFFYILTALVMAGAILLISADQREKSWPGPYDVFCDTEVLSRIAYYEDDLILVLYTHKPIYPGHSLIIPKRCILRFEEMTDAEILRMGQVIKMVDKAVSSVFGTSSYMLLQKNGRESFQDVPHVHMHYIPRKAGSTSMIGFFYHFFTAEAGAPISAQEMAENVAKLRAAMDQLK